jgi:hypothetical protein
MSNLRDHLRQNTLHCDTHGNQRGNIRDMINKGRRGRPFPGSRSVK